MLYRNGKQVAGMDQFIMVIIFDGKMNVMLKECIHVNLLWCWIDKVETLYVQNMNWSNSTKEWEMVGSNLAKK
jgi:hypothetical protein